MSISMSKNWFQIAYVTLWASCLLALILASHIKAAPATWDDQRERRVMLYDYLDNNPQEFLVQLLQNQINAQRLYSGDNSVKRSRGILDFGVSRGTSGAEAAKARLGLKLANDPYGPGKRR